MQYSFADYLQHLFHIFCECMYLNSSPTFLTIPTSATSL